MEHTWSQISSIPIDKNAVDIQDVIATETNLDNLIEQSSSSLPTLKKDTTLKRKRKTKTLADDDDSDDDITATLALLKKSRKTKSKSLDNDMDNDFAESKFLHSVDAQEKSQNRKSLQFYAAQIAQKGAKRREKYSGDMEVFKERRNDRNERQIEEARKRGLPSKTTDDDTTTLNANQSDDDDQGESQTRRKNVDEDDYYDFIAAKTAKKKAHGKEDYETSKAAARAYILGMTDEGQLDESGKRLITRQIEKNKGLTPKRSKDVRNPRVKKRKKYEKKKIALKGRQQVYQVNDRRRGAYGGEESGISKNVVRGVKLQ
jgi:U3 small nucleolar RNA-associated protein 3